MTAHYIYVLHDVVCVYKSNMWGCTVRMVQGLLITDEAFIVYRLFFDP